MHRFSNNINQRTQVRLFRVIQKRQTTTIEYHRAENYIYFWSLKALCKNLS